MKIMDAAGEWSQVWEDSKIETGLKDTQEDGEDVAWNDGDYEGCVG